MARVSSMLILASFAFGCAEPAQMTGSVTDVWGKPLGGATVQFEGVVDHTTTDAEGHFSFVVPDPGKRRIMAGHDGYVRNTAEITISDDKDAVIPSPVVKLYPEPEQPGFYAVNLRSFDHLEAKPITTVGTEIHAYTGVADIGTVALAGKGKREFVFRSTLRSSELARLDLQLHRLEFITVTPVPGVLGEAEVKVNLHVVKDAAKDTQKFDLKALPTDDTYLITTREPLKPGIYAFDTEGLLTSHDDDVLSKTPKEMQVAYPFEVK